MEFKVGDIIACRSDKFLSKAIRWFMSKYKKVPNVDTFSHNAIVVDIWGELWVVEALGWGVRVQSIKDSGYIDHKQALVLRHKNGFTDQQVRAMSSKMVSLGGVRYQYENFPAWVAKIFLKINLFKNRSEKSIYCSELAAIALNTAFPGMYVHPNMTSPMDHMMNPALEIIDYNGILNK